MNPSLDNNVVLLGGNINDSDSKIYEIADVKYIPNSLTLIKLNGDVRCVVNFLSNNLRKTNFSLIIVLVATYYPLAYGWTVLRYHSV